jgi:hypothetical protein
VKEVAEEESRAARMESGDGEADVTEIPSESQEEEVSSAPARPRRSRENGRSGRENPRSRRGRGNARNRPQGEDTGSPAELTAGPVEVSPPSIAEPSDESLETKPEAPQKFRARRFQSRRPPAEVVQDAVPEQPIIATGAPSNDQDKVDIDSSEKKKGWWNRLIEK